MKKTLLFILGLLVLAGCTSKKNEQPEIVKDPNTIVFDANPTTGYAWSYKWNQDGIIELDEEYISDQIDKEVTGSGGKMVYKIKPLKEGTTTVTFTYQRPWESTDSDSIVVYEITVDEQLNVEPKLIETYLD